MTFKTCNMQLIENINEIKLKEKENNTESINTRIYKSKSKERKNC